MQTVFSHIVSNRLSQEYENVATESLAFILNYSESTRNGMMRLLRGIAPEMPGLLFRTQETEQVNKRNFRPDMVGYHDNDIRLFIENKFEAGLTDNQPMSYLQKLAKCTQPSILLVVVPEAREETMWGELNRRLKAADISVEAWNTVSGSIVHSLKTDFGPILALTSWTRLLSILEDEVTDDPSARNDLLQLRALCEAADRNAFIPFSPVVITDQRIPAFILQLNSIWQSCIEKAVNEGIINLKGTTPQADSERTGRYIYFSREIYLGGWLGVHFRFWKNYGRTPLWFVFSGTQWGRAREVWSLVEPLAEKEGVFTKLVGNEFIIAIDLPFGEEKDQVVRHVVDRLKWISNIVRTLPPNLPENYTP